MGALRGSHPAAASPKAFSPSTKPWEKSREELCGLGNPNVPMPPACPHNDSLEKSNGEEMHLTLLTMALPQSI